MARHFATVIAMPAFRSARLCASLRAVASMALRYATVTTRQLLTAALSTRHGTSRAAHMPHLAMATYTHPVHKLGAAWMLTEVASRSAFVAASKVSSTRSVAGWWCCATDHGRWKTFSTTSTREWFTNDHAAWFALPQVTEVLAHVNPTRQLFATNQQTKVRLMIPLIEAWTADRVAAMSPA